MTLEILGMTVASEMIAALLLAFTAGMCVPFRFGIERLRGFGRAVVSKLPYQPPPGVEEGRALEAATEDNVDPGEPDGDASEAG